MGTHPWPFDIDWALRLVERRTPPASDDPVAHAHRVYLTLVAELRELLAANQPPPAADAQPVDELAP